MCHAGPVSDVVPPGGDRPIDDEPWPARATTPVRQSTARLPSVPTMVPDGIDAPVDWRTLDADADFAPPGYRPVGAPWSGATTRLDSFGVASTVTGLAGLVQLILLPVPLLAVLAITLGLSGRRFGRLDPDGVRARIWSTVGLALGVAGVLTGAALILADVRTVLTG